jgi:putative endonuclease
MSSKEYRVYLVRCADNSLYCGVSSNVEERINTHNKGKGAKYCRGLRLPVTLVAVSHPFHDIGNALSFEYCVKKQAKKDKVKYLIQNVI